MTDPRYLVPVSALPLVPLGAWCWWERQGDLLLPCIYHNASTNPPFVLADGQSWWFDRGALYLDLSAPSGDPPTRLDALGWALDVLSARLGVEIMRDAAYQIHPQEIRREWHAWTCGPHGPGHRVALATYADVPPTGDICADRRAVVAHALRAHVRKEPTP